MLLIDRATFPRDKICAGAIGARADRRLDAIGARVNVPSAPLHALAVTTGAGTLRASLAGANIGRVIRRKAFDAALLERARERGAEVQTGVSFERFEERSACVDVHTEHGTITTRWLVGADGVGSRVRRQLGLDRGDFYAQAVEVDTPWCDADQPDLDQERGTLHFDLRDGMSGYAWDFPTVLDGASLACRGIYQLVRGADGERREISELLDARLRSLGLDPARYPKRRFAERGLSLHEPISRGRILLVGEAAGIDPVLGEGIPQAILYGEAAASFLSAHLSAGSNAPADYRAHVMRSRVGLDLRVRARAVRWVYGPRRPHAERLVTRSKALADCGLHYFAGLRVPRTKLLRAAADFAAQRAALALSST